MTANPLSGRGRTPACYVTFEMLHSYAETLNRQRWVRDSRKPYFVNKRADADGIVTHFLDR